MLNITDKILEAWNPPKDLGRFEELLKTQYTFIEQSVEKTNFKKEGIVYKFNSSVSVMLKVFNEDIEDLEKCLYIIETLALNHNIKLK